jgi:glycosyltransferase involved in cell wall biosynthesis
MGISIVVPTCNGGRVFEKCLRAIQQQAYDGERELIVIDSGSTDGTPQTAAEAGATVIPIDRKTFHHARTRNQALTHAHHDAVVFLVQDAVPVSRSWLADLESALLQSDVAAVYTQQIPHDDAGAYARFEVEAHANYLGSAPVIHRFTSPQQYWEMPYDEAYRSIRLNNVCAIYSRKHLLAKPFPDEAFAEDMAWALESLLGGQRIMYQPAVRVKHSHDRTPAYRFNREVINALYCAKIMKRVRDDLSALSISDLIHLTCRFERIFRQIRGSLPQPAGQHHASGRPALTGHVTSRFSTADKLIYHLLNMFSKKKPANKQLAHDLEIDGRGQIDYILGCIGRQFETPPLAEMLDSLEQATAGVLGRIYGEVYAGRFLNNKLNPRFESFMMPFLQGV